MASVLAIVSKAIFEKDFPSAQPGEVLPIDRYASKQPAFDQLGKGDAIFLVTVKSGNVPWLVAVLEQPKRKGGAWVAAKKNRAAVSDLTETLPRLAFSTGTRIARGAKNLGMALQAPRKLTSDDVALLRARGGSPAVKEYRDQVAATPAATATTKAAAAEIKRTPLVLAHRGKPFEKLAKLPGPQRKQLEKLTRSARAGTPEDCKDDETWAPMQLADVRVRKTRETTHQLWVWSWGSAALFAHDTTREVGRAIQHRFEMDKEDDPELRRALAGAYAFAPLGEHIDFLSDPVTPPPPAFDLERAMKGLKKSLGASKERYRALTRAQEKVVRDLLEHEPEEDPISDLEALGLPSFTVLRRWVALDPPTILESTVAKRPAWRWIKDATLDPSKEEPALRALAHADVGAMLWQALANQEAEYAFLGLHSMKWDKGESYANRHAQRVIRFFGALLARSGAAIAFADRAKAHLAKDAQFWLAAVATFGLAARAKQMKEPFPKRYYALAQDADFLGNGLNLQDAMRDVIELVPEKDREAFVDEYCPDAGTSWSEEFKKGRRTEVPMLLHKWWFADLVPTSSMAQALALDMEQWDNDPKPAEEALAVIRKLGPICAPHLQRALKKTKSRHKKVLERALALVRD